ncbi:uncharacterized protein JCM10292_000734 [Rhodotorula paludigena]|uniref:uncharacterized protein n=1 Tax=Rhodotorula paludigena TaxID=86838 RepID=UPI00316D09BC
MNRHPASHASSLDLLSNVALADEASDTLRRDASSTMQPSSSMRSTVTDSPVPSPAPLRQPVTRQRWGPRLATTGTTSLDSPRRHVPQHSQTYPPVSTSPGYRPQFSPLPQDRQIQSTVPRTALLPPPSSLYTPSSSLHRFAERPSTSLAPSTAPKGIHQRLSTPGPASVAMSRQMPGIDAARFGPTSPLALPHPRPPRLGIPQSPPSRAAVTAKRSRQVQYSSPEPDDSDDDDYDPLPSRTPTSAVTSSALFPPAVAHPSQIRASTDVAAALKRNPNPVVSTTLWEDERTVVMQVLVEGHVVARRSDNDWINSTKLLNMVKGMTRGKRDMYLKGRLSPLLSRQVFRRGALHLKGVWLPLSAAVRLARTYGLYDRLFPLFEPDLQSYLFLPINRERTTQLVQAARSRAALMRKPDASSGLREREREDLRIRGEALERRLTELEIGLGLAHPGGEEEVDDGGERDARDVEQESSSAKDTAQASEFPSPPPTARVDGAPSIEPREGAAGGQAPFTRPTPSASPHPADVVADPPALPSFRPIRFPTSIPSPSASFSPPVSQYESRPAVYRSQPSFPVLPAPIIDRPSPVSWYDNPTPLPQPLIDYGSSAPDSRVGGMSREGRRLSSLRSSGSGGSEMQLDEPTTDAGARSPVDERGRSPSVAVGRACCSSTVPDSRNVHQYAPTSHPLSSSVLRSASLPPYAVPQPLSYSPQPLEPAYHEAPLTAPLPPAPLDPFFPSQQQQYAADAPSGWPQGPAAPRLVSFDAAVSQIRALLRTVPAPSPASAILPSPVAHAEPNVRAGLTWGELIGGEALYAEEAADAATLSTEQAPGSAPSPFESAFPFDLSRSACHDDAADLDEGEQRATKRAKITVGDNVASAL